jgi:hypothetical protein
MIRNFLLGDGHTVASHAGHLAWVVGAGAVAWFLVAMVLRLSKRQTNVRFAAPPPRQQGGGLLAPVIAAVVVLCFGYFYDKAKHPAATAAARAAASPSPSASASPSPRPVPTVTEITRVVNAHPLLSGWQIVLICVIAAVIILGGLSLARRFF